MIVENDESDDLRRYKTLNSFCPTMGCNLISKWIKGYPPITHYWTMPLILGHSYHVGKPISSRIADTKVSRF
jgi:hypothetical protein